MSIEREEIQKKVEEEHNITSRYPIRLIFCNSLAQYNALVLWLRTSCELTLNLAEFCGDDDKHPKFSKLMKRIKGEADKHILLLSIGEYLRLAIIRETTDPQYAQFRDFWCEQYSVDSKIRVFIPVFAAKELFERVVKEVDERQGDFLWSLDDDSSDHYNVIVYSDRFKNTLADRGVIVGFKNWLLNWVEALSTQQPVLVTARFKDCEKTYGQVSVNIIESPYEFLCGMEPGISMIPSSCAPDDYWARLLSDTQRNESVADAILATLNLKYYDSISVVSQWENLDDIERWYAWIWHQLYSPKDYAGTIIHNLSPNDLQDTATHIANDIILYADNKDWITQRRGIMQGMRNAVPSSKFFDALDKRMPETALGLLTAQSQEERAFIVKTVSRWLRLSSTADTVDRLITALKGLYPELAYYLETPRHQYKSFTDYFGWYKKSKLINRPVKSPISTFDVESIDARYSILAKYNGSDCKALWVDGLGIEWLSLICAVLDKKTNDLFDFTSNIAISRLPSETAFNEQWADNDFKYIKHNRLDTLAHKGVPDDSDYFLCIVAQIQTVCEMLYEAVELLESNDLVIITGDHGSSRLAALAFHELATFAPPGAIPMSHGRFCELTKELRDEDLLPNVALCRFNDKKYLVMKDYEHYKQSGNAAGGNSDENAVAGEIHGGMTPEECIVPVVVLKRKNVPKPLNYVFSAEKLAKRGGKASIEISFNRSVDTLDIASSNGVCICSRIDEKQWSINFTGLEGASIELSITANGKVLPQEAVLPVITVGISKGSMGGLP
ncbi:BREX-4 system phosphatase PglZ [Acididesulfobacillus acetoxydans]|uniref:BREX-4 system phosphatase PglZ n=1 Tax=Acididesulfobacillus acetoxydans TaxID=1561005 RepID=UPI001F0D61B8|nr:BREX-4 system phosphatase PglZ [Acididesulfobacillus acetoxydans]